MALMKAVVPASQEAARLRAREMGEVGINCEMSSNIGSSSDIDTITVTVRLIRSFQYRNIKHIVFHNINPDLTVAEFKKQVNADIQVRPGLLLPLRKHSYDTMKILYKAHGAKTSNPVINIGDESLIVSDEDTLRKSQIENETEISYFKLDEYLLYKASPETMW